MTYLLAKYAVIFLLAAFLGFLLGRWSIRRSFVDVTESYQTISRAATNEVPWDSLWARFDSLDTNVRMIVKDELDSRPFPRIPEPDLTPITQRIVDLDTRVADMPVPSKQDLGPLNDRLKIIEAHITKLSQPTSVPPQSLRLLHSASHGQADDLKRISGIGPMLEKLLNKHGVYYFWQIAEWTHDDVETMDNRLEVFKGRITRDNWVKQAETLARNAKSATPPSDVDLLSSPLIS